VDKKAKKRKWKGKKEIGRENERMKVTRRQTEISTKDSCL
jgi:hypothetical protein